MRSTGRGAILTLGIMLLCLSGVSQAQSIRKPAPKAQVMLGIRVVKVMLPKKYSGGLDWKAMPFKPGLNDEIDFFKVLKKLKSVGEIEILFNQSLIGIAGGKIEADTARTIPSSADTKENIEIGARFTSDIAIKRDVADLVLNYKISYLYGSMPYGVAKTEFKANVSIANGQTLVLNDLIVEEGREKKYAEVLVFISALITK